MALVAASADWAPSNKDLPKDSDNYAGKKRGRLRKIPTAEILWKMGRSLCSYDCWWFLQFLHLGTEFFLVPWGPAFASKKYMPLQKTAYSN